MKHLALFIKLYIWFGLRFMWMHRVRALIVVLGIALGAAVFTSVRLSIHASLTSFSNSVDLLSGKSDIVLINTGGRLPDRLITDLVRHPAVRQTSAILSTYVRVEDKEEPFLLIGIDPLLDRPFRNWDTPRQADTDEAAIWVDLISKPFTIIVSDYLARKNSWSADQKISLVHTRQTADFTLLGILKTEGLALAEGGRIAITDISSFQEFTGTTGTVDRVDLILTDTAKKLSGDMLENQLKSILPPGSRLELPSETKAAGQSMIRAYQLNLSILSFAALFVGTFLVYSLVALNAAGRRHELAVLRSTGASSRMIFFLFLSEGAFLGLLGWLMAFPVAGLLVRYLLQGVSRTISTLFVRVHVDSLSLDPWEVILSFGITVLVSVLAAFQPAREAMRVDPKEVMAATRQQSDYRKTARRLAVAGLPLVLIAWPLSWLPGIAGLPLAGYAAMFLLFVGFAMLAPFSLEKLGSLAAPPLRRLAGISAYLAGRYVRDSGTRTAISVGSLITAVALFTSLVIMIHSFRSTVQLWVRQTVSGDLFISAKMGAINRFRDAMDTRIVTGLQQLQSAVDIVQNRRFTLKHGRFVYELDALNLEIFLRHGNFVWVSGDPLTGRTALLRGDGVVVSEVYSNKTGLGTGDRYRARLGKTMVDLPILGVVRDYRTDGGVVFYDHRAFGQRYFDPGWSGARLFFRKPPEDPDIALDRLRAEVISRCGTYLDMIDGRELRSAVLRIFDETFAITTVLLSIALLIAALGITTTLAVQVLERSRQLNTLYAVGASLQQIRSMIFWEAGLLVLAGEVAGLICGFILSFILIYVINIQSFGWSFMYAVNWQSLSLSLPLIILTALVAALPAIRLIFSQSPATVLKDR